MIIVVNGIATSEPLDTPVFGWKSVVTAAGVAATSEETDHPASNVANPSTALKWVAAPGSPEEDQYLTVTIDTVDDIDYVGIAGHNLGSGRIPVSVEGATQEVGSPPEPDWTEIVPESMRADDTPLIFRFTPQSLSQIRIRMQPGAAAPEIAVVYVGKLLVAERGTSADHVPVNLGRQTNVVTGRSESGRFLGRIVIGESRQTALSLQHMRASWYRANMDPFIAAAQEDPFFFAWRPQTFPADVGFCWLTSDPRPEVAFETGRMSLDLQMGGAL